jgi:hypothetical protein
MAQIFHRRSNTLARLSLVLAGLIVIVLGVTLDLLQRSPWVTRQGQRPEQPVLFSHKHHVQGLGLNASTATFRRRHRAAPEFPRPGRA